MKNIILRILLSENTILIAGTIIAAIEVIFLC